ncbi:hypothetical protein [Streptomyces sparsus]
MAGTLLREVAPGGRTTDKALIAAPMPTATGVARGAGSFCTVHATVAAQASTVCPSAVVLASPRSLCAEAKPAIEKVEPLFTQGKNHVHVRQQITHDPAGELGDVATAPNKLDQLPNEATVASPIWTASLAESVANATDTMGPSAS